VRVTNLRRDVNSFALRLHKVCDLRGHRMENVSVQISQVCRTVCESFIHLLSIVEELYRL
jgi:hypothetical protein